jgi:surface carbohydrate biosynthesis protein
LHIGFVIDHPGRDLPAAAMIVHAAVKKGHRVSVIPMYEQALDVPLLALDALVVNYARPTNLELVRAYAAQGIAVFVLDNEGGIMSEQGANSPNELARYIRESGYAEVLAGYFFWGSRPFDAALANNAMPGERLHLTGCPRYDLASERWSALLSYPRRDYILINTNFPLLNPLFSLSRAKERQTAINVGWSDKYVDDVATDTRGILDGLLKLIPELARSNPDRTFLVRPHPFENPELYTSRFHGIGNVIIDGRGSVLNAARNAACVLHVNCGSSVEAAMLRRVPISLEFLNTDLMRRHSPLPHAISWKASSVADLDRALKHTREIEQEFDFRSVHRKYIYPWFHENDGRACDRIVDVVERSSRTSPWSSRAALRQSLRASRRRNSAGQRLQAVLANAVGSLAASKLRARFSPARARKRIAPEDLSAWLRGLAEHEGTPVPVVRRAVHPAIGANLSSMEVTPP